jgi:hypothetical protein
MDEHHLLAAGSTSFPICCFSKQSLENAPKGVKGGCRFILDAVSFCRTSFLSPPSSFPAVA